MTNLLGNALENIPAGSEVIIQSGEDDKFVTLAVSDTGPGIPPDKLPHLFERYQFVRETRKRLGAGLGLSICKMIMELHHGHITVSSVTGQGTTFTLAFPKA